MKLNISEEWWLAAADREGNCEVGAGFEPFPDIRTEEQLPGCWVAYDADRYDGPGSPIGSGFSEQKAIVDLLEQLESRREAASRRLPCDGCDGYECDKECAYPMPKAPARSL